MGPVFVNVTSVSLTRANVARYSNAVEKQREENFNYLVKYVDDLIIFITLKTLTGNKNDGNWH